MTRAHRVKCKVTDVLLAGKKTIRINERKERQTGNFSWKKCQSIHAKVSWSQAEGNSYVPETSEGLNRAPYDANWDIYRNLQRHNIMQVTPDLLN